MNEALRKYLMPVFAPDDGTGADGDVLCCKMVLARLTLIEIATSPGRDTERRQRLAPVAGGVLTITLI